MASHVVFFGLMLVAVGTIVFSLLSGPAEATRCSVFRVGALLACVAGPFWFV